MNNSQNYSFLRQRHVKFFKRCLQVLPHSSVTYDTSRMTVLYFALSGLDLLDEIDEIDKNEKDKIIDWIYSLQITPKNSNDITGGFLGGSSLLCGNFDKDSNLSEELNSGHITMTYTALASLIILGDDLRHVDRKAVLKHVAALQSSDGSFYSTIGGSENDMRFVYCAACVCYILKDFSYINVDAAVTYITSCQSYEGGIGQNKFREAHGGSTYCGVAALYLMGVLHEAFTQKQIHELCQWLLLKQDSLLGGFKGRPNKESDTCYSFWVGASLKLMNCYDYINAQMLEHFVLQTQDPITGGLGKNADTHPDGLHTYLGISGLALLNKCELKIKAIFPALNISQSAAEHLIKLQQSWT